MEKRFNHIPHMAVAGYSGTPLLKKLGIKEGLKLWLIDPPPDYYTLLESDVSGQLCAPAGIPDWVHVFAETRELFERQMRRLSPVWRKNPQVVIWISWYKKSSGRATDLTEDVIRGYALARGLVDIKVCAVSPLWSGLKLVVPVKNR